MLTKEQATTMANDVLRQQRNLATERKMPLPYIYRCQEIAHLSANDKNLLLQKAKQKVAEQWTMYFALIMLTACMAAAYGLQKPPSFSALATVAVAIGTSFKLIHTMLVRRAIRQFARH